MTISSMSRGLVGCLAFVGTIVSSGCEGSEGPAGDVGPQGDEGPAGADGADGTDGTNGTNGTDGVDGADGAGCTAVDNGDGTFTVTCGEDTFEVSDGADGAAGADGDSCTVADNGDGTFTITCGETSIVATDPGWVPAAYEAADGIAGGTAYSQWWVTQAGGLGTLAAYSVAARAEFTRCKTCHAWDGLGNAGSYANRSGMSTGNASRPDVSSVDLRATVAFSTPTELYDLIRNEGGRDIDTEGNGHPDYSALLTDTQVWNIVRFLREEWVSPEELYRLAVDGPPIYTDGVGAVHAPTLFYFGIGAGGNATNGDALYTAECALCHGADGRTISIGGQSLGQTLRGKPHEVYHKVKFGQIAADSTVSMDPGALVATQDLLDLYAALTDTVTYPDM